MGVAEFCFLQSLGVSEDGSDLGASDLTCEGKLRSFSSRRGLSHRVTIQSGPPRRDSSGWGKGLPHVGLKTSAHGGTRGSCLLESCRSLAESRGRQQRGLSLTVARLEKPGHLVIAAGSRRTVCQAGEDRDPRALHRLSVRGAPWYPGSAFHLWRWWQGQDENTNAVLWKNSSSC